MFNRFLHEEARNPLSGHEYWVEVAARISQSTLEYLSLYMINILIFSIVTTEKLLFLVPFFTFWFTVGRIAFSIGYQIHPLYKEFGFVWTFAPICVLLGYNLVKVTFGINVETWFL